MNFVPKPDCEGDELGREAAKDGKSQNDSLRLLVLGGKLRMLRAPILAVSVLAGWMTAW